MNLKSLSRAFTSNLGGIVVSPAEQTALTAEGIAEPTIQRYVLWRRATILMVVIFTALSAAISTYSTFTEEDEADVTETITNSLLDDLETKVETVSPDAAKFLKSLHSGGDIAVPADIKGAALKKAEELEEKAEKIVKPDAEKPEAEKPEKPEKAEPDKSDKDEKADKPDDEKAEPDKAESEKAEKEKTGAAEKDEEGEKIKAMGRIADGLRLLSLYVLPIAALITIFLRNRFGLSFRIMAIAFVFSFFAPMLMALCPWSWWGVVEPKFSSANPMLYIKDQAEGVMEGAALLVGLLPSVLSLIPGVQRACLRVKTLLPQALLPGWFIVVASPLYGLFLLVIVVAVDQFVSEPAILVPLALLAAASLTYAVRASVFTRPLLCEADFRRVRSVQRVVALMSALAGLILVSFLATREINGIHLVGSVAKSSFVRPIEIVEFIMEVLGRSMFVSALGAEFILRLSVTAWRHNRAIVASDVATTYDEAMAASGDVLAPEAAQ